MINNIEKLSSIGFFDIKPGLDRIFNVLEALGNPQNKIRYVLIAGTNGKGSVSSILSNILIANGHNTGLYTSPHLISVTERIKINNENINEDDFNSCLGEVFNVCEELNTSLSYFELVTAAAFVHFFKKEIDIGVLEVGMGGRWDATNVVLPLVSVITNISIDHTKHLGGTTKLISKEKAEIIKKNVPVVCGVSGRNLEIFKSKAAESRSNIYVLGKDFKYKRSEDGKFSFSGIENELDGLTTNLAGEHQIVNSTLAITVSELLKMEDNIDVDFNTMMEPLNSVKKNGRFEIINVNPTVVLDCAHNTGSAEALKDTLDEFCSDGKFVFMISMLEDKDAEGFINVISGKARKIILTKIPNVRGADTEKLLQISKSYVDDCEIINDYKEAYEYVKSLNRPVCITGSIYLIGLIKEYLEN